MTMHGQKVGVALGSGGAKGFAHIGVLKAFEEHGIPVHALSGSSMGSLIGAFYATGMKPDFMERFALTMRFRHWTDFTVPKIGLISGEKIHDMVKLLTRGLLIEQANIPLAIVATELLERKPVIFRKGLIADAVRASISIPGVFVPYVREDGIYVDGGVTTRVPVAACRSLGASVVIAVDVSTGSKGNPPENIMEVILQSLDIMQDYATLGQDDFPDVLIQPDVSKVATSHFHRAKEAIDAGYEAAIQKMEEIRSVLEHRARETC
jgi:NTE family protein